jgi:uncharacterized protein YndB with AHSA1/START domain
MSSTPAATTDKAARTFTMSIDINASPEDVWRALTDAGELVRWFPLEARVKSGKGGSVFWGWHDNWAWESQIETWEPGRTLRLIENRAAFDANGKPMEGPTQKMAMEFTLETHGGITRLRLVHSGFGQGANWDDELDGISGGWQVELRGLKLYLERHKGQDRHHAFAQRVSPLDQPAVWSRLFSPAAFVVTSGRIAQDERCVIRAATGDQFSGSIKWHNPGADVLLIVDDLDDGFFRLSTWRAAGKTGIQTWLSTYSPRHAGRVKEYGARAKALFEQLFP